MQTIPAVVLQTVTGGGNTAAERRDLARQDIGRALDALIAQRQVQGR